MYLVPSWLYLQFFLVFLQFEGVLKYAHELWAYTNSDSTWVSVVGLDAGKVFSLLVTTTAETQQQQRRHRPVSLRSVCSLDLQWFAARKQLLDVIYLTEINVCFDKFSLNLILSRSSEFWLANLLFALHGPIPQINFFYVKIKWALCRLQIL